MCKSLSAMQETTRMMRGQLEVRADELRLTFADGSVVVPSAEEIFRYAFQGEDKIRDVRVTATVPESLKFSRFPLTLMLHVKADKRGDDIGIFADIVGTTDGVIVSISNISQRQSDHVVHEGTWYPLAKGALEEIRSILGKEGIADLRNVTIRQYLELTRIAISNPFIADDTDHLLDAGHAAKPDTAPILSGFTGRLYPYQETGHAWLTRLTREGVGCILGDEMGLGKTVQVIALLVSRCPSDTPSLIVAPATILENWRRELARFAPNIRVGLHLGVSRTGFPRDLRDVDVVLTSYDTAVRDLSMLKMIRWALVLVDEAQAIKNPDTKRTIALKALPRSVAIAVTGTPVENRLTDLWSIVDFVLPGWLGDLPHFEKAFADVPPDAARLEPLVSPILLRRRVADVAHDLPPRIDIPQPLNLGAEEAVEYEKLRSEIEAEYGESASLVAIGKLRQFCAHPLQITGGWHDPTEHSSKYVRLLELLEEIFSNREKALVFLHYHHVTDVFIKDLAKRFTAYTDWIDGRVDASARQWKVDQFSESTGSAVLLLNPRTAGTGLNLTAANHVIHFSPDWNPAVEDQASARAYRRGQTKPVTVHRLFFTDTVEEVIIQRLERKRQLAKEAVVGTSGEEEDRVDILRALKASPLKRSG
jgi:SNF2 family DNA or RNA helicase